MNDSDCESLLKLKEALEEELTSGILPYWIENTVDHKNGGFFGRITFENVPVKDAEKGSVLTSRILYTFSASYKKFSNPAHKKMADRAYAYLINSFWDQEFGGVYWMVDSNGQPASTRKYVYAQAFAIYALSEYFSATRVDAALEQAQKLFKLTESKCFDHKYGGYFEAYSREWQLLDDMRLSEKDRNEPKSMNTHLHLLEAYTNLYRFWNSKELKLKLNGLLDLFINHIIDPKQNSLITFLAEDWAPRSQEISFGHNIESSWLLLEAADVLGDYPQYESLQKICLSLANVVKDIGMDANGGIFNKSSPAGLTDDDKDWWPQAEAIVGFVNAYELSANTSYLQAAYKVWDFIKEHFIDSTYGDWHEKVTRSGVPYRLDKVRSWKCPYHNGRAVLEIMNRTDSLISESVSETSNAPNIVS